MNPEIKKLIEELQTLAALYANEVGTYQTNTSEADHVATQAAVILQAIFDPENQPSQFGTVLLDPRE